MIQYLSSSKKTNIETLYQKISYFPQFQLIISSWFSHTYIMTNDDFLSEIELIHSRIVNTKSNKILFDFKQFDFFISPTLLSQYIKNHDTEIKTLTIKKIALILPENNIVKMSIEQVFEYLQDLVNYSSHSFLTIQPALQWLKK